MKSILASLCFVIILFTSCSKAALDVTTNTLSGTTWVCKSVQSGVTSVETLTFTNNTSFTYVLVDTGTLNTRTSDSGTYTYTVPTVTLVTTAGVTNTFTIDGNYANGKSLDGSINMTFTKQ